MPELMALIKVKRSLEFQQKKFAAALKGIPLHEEGEKTFDDVVGEVMGELDQEPDMGLGFIEE